MQQGDDRVKIRPVAKSVAECQIIYTEKTLKYAFTPITITQFFSSHLATFLHGYIRGIRDILQLCSPPHDFKNPETGDGSDEKLAAKDSRTGAGKPQGRQR